MLACWPAEAAVSLVVLCLSALPVSAHSEARRVPRYYRLTNLGARIHGPSTAYAISDSGLVAGNAAGRSDRSNENYEENFSISDPIAPDRPVDSIVGVLWRRGIPHRLGAGSGYAGCYVTDVNSSGQVAGNLDTSFNGAYMGTHESGFIWHRGNYDTLSGGGYMDSEAYAINNSGEVAGAWVYSAATGPDDSYIDHAMLWRHDIAQDLGEGHATCINAEGDVAGCTVMVGPTGRPMGNAITVPDSDMYADAWLWRHGKRVVIGSGRPNGINDSGQIVGVTSPHKSGEAVVDWGRAVLWQLRMATDLGTLGGRESSAASINNLGQIVGWARDTKQAKHAFLWENGRMYDLNGLVRSHRGWILEQASCINNHGCIVGWGWHGGAECAFLLTPEGTKKARIEPFITHRNS